LPPKARRQNFQTISWFWDLYNRELLDLDPPYQRRSVWNQSYMDSFIDTILLQYPAPAIFLYEEVADSGIAKYHVVDGKQRLMAVFKFAAGEFPVSEDSIVTHLRDKKLEQLNVEERTAFWTYQFSVEYLPTNEETVISGIFERINKNTAKLTRQELRHAKLSGQFITLAEDMAELMSKRLPEGYPRLESQSRKQMKDVELVANLLLFFEDGPHGYSQDELDQAFTDRDIEWEQKEDTKSRFTATLECVNSIVRQPPSDPLFKTRMRNQADFYSLFTAVAEILDDGVEICADPEAVDRLSRFVKVLDDDNQLISSTEALSYFGAARSNSNDSRPRMERTRILRNVILGWPG
jgi:Protein of unknown function DUF262